MVTLTKAEQQQRNKYLSTYTNLKIILQLHSVSNVHSLL